MTEQGDEKRAEALRGGTDYAFIPHALDLPAWKPELTKFPFNVMFMTRGQKDAEVVTGTAIYEPEFWTYKKEGSLACMRYRNIYNSVEGECHLMIVYDESKPAYHGTKYVNGEVVREADGGDDWKNFFVHLTMRGLAQNERCEFEAETKAE